MPFVAGKLKQFASVSQTITSEYFILIAATGVNIEFANYTKQTTIPREYNFNATELDVINNQIEKFSEIGIIEKRKH